MSKERMRFTLKAYDHRLLDYVCGKIIETVKRTGGKVVGPVPLPTKVEKITILRAVHKYKDSREQFERSFYAYDIINIAIAFFTHFVIYINITYIII